MPSTASCFPLDNFSAQCVVRPFHSVLSLLSQNLPTKQVCPEEPSAVGEQATGPEGSPGPEVTQRPLLSCGGLSPAASADGTDTSGLTVISAVRRFPVSLTVAIFYHMVCASSDNQEASKPVQWLPLEGQLHKAGRPCALFLQTALTSLSAPFLLPDF